MSFAVAGLHSKQPVTVADMSCADTSFPGFAALLESLAAMIVAVDGPAASGKGTIAKALARHYGLPHMDTGLLYRAVALNLLALRRRSRTASSPPPAPATSRRPTSTIPS